MFGVSYANLKILEKRLKKEGSACLAYELWAAGNHDGCVLAAKIANPTSMTQIWPISGFVMFRIVSFSLTFPL